MGGGDHYTRDEYWGNYEGGLNCITTRLRQGVLERERGRCPKKAVGGRRGGKVKGRVVSLAPGTVERPSIWELSERKTGKPNLGGADHLGLGGGKRPNQTGISTPRGSDGEVFSEPSGWSKQDKVDPNTRGGGPPAQTFHDTTRIGGNTQMEGEGGK